MANAGLQIRHLGDLFCPRSRAPTYWYGVVGNESVADLETLYTKSKADIESGVFARRDEAVDRRHRVLDLLLALYGQTYTQGSLRRSLAHLGGDELETLLLDNKRDFLLQTEVLSRDRAAGFDVAKKHWDSASNTSGLQRCVSLLLGFRHRMARSMVGALARRGLELVDDESAALGAPIELSQEQLDALRPVPAAHDVAAGESPRWAGAGAGRWPSSLVRSGAARARYRLMPIAGGDFELMLQADAEAHRWWRLCGPQPAALAARVAAAIRRDLLALNDDAEGMHVVEHVLLRPRRTDGPHRLLDVPASFYTLRVTVVLADWPARAQDPSFQRLADETVRLNAPAHVATQCIWLDFGAMVRFEQHLKAWLDTLRACSLALPGNRDAQALDEAACAVIRELRRHGVR
jgi:hypothetical protein